ncbi:MAG TPA: hypothetical protein VGL56_20820 [Fimbriimonadaceae bacterium]|jgi:ketosteroid isomerase-like protein
MKSLLLIGTTLTLAGLVHAQTPTIKDAMHNVYDGIEAAYNKKDINGVMSYLTPDYSWRMMDGKNLNLSDAKKDIKEQFDNMQSGKWTVNIQNVMGAGRIATAVVMYQFKGAMRDQTKQLSNVTITSIERQTWINGANGWKQTQDTILSQSSRLDGMTTKPNVKDTSQPIQTGPGKQGNNNGSQDQPVSTGP